MFQVRKKQSSLSQSCVSLCTQALLLPSFPSLEQISCNWSCQGCACSTVLLLGCFVHDSPVLYAVSWLHLSYFSSWIVVQKICKSVNVVPAELFCFLNTFWTGVDGVHVRKRQSGRLMLQKGCALTQEGQRRTSVVVFGFVHAEFLFVFLPSLLLNVWLHTFGWLLRDHCFPHFHIFSTELVSIQVLCVQTNLALPSVPGSTKEEGISAKNIRVLFRHNQAQCWECSEEKIRKSIRC